jgi:autotransporter adhesin
MSWAGIVWGGRQHLKLALALLSLLTGVVVTGPAQAQFVCDSTTPGGADGATAAAGAVACGTNATASGLQSTAVGNSATASGNNSSAYGLISTASGVQSSAFGVQSAATGAGSSAFGNSSEASGIQSTAVGNSSTASGNNASAFGLAATANGTSSAAIGAGAEAGGVNSVALGSTAQANFDNSTAIGGGAQTTAANQVAIGTSSNTYKISGITSAASTAAQTGPVSVVTTDSNGNLAAVDLASLGLGGADLSAINSRLDEHDKKISKNTEGVAIALAMAGVPTLTASEKFAMSANWGTFEGENGFAAGGAVRLDSNVQINGGIGFGGETVGGRAGVRIGW